MEGYLGFIRCCEHGNKPSVSRRYGEFIAYMRNYYLLTRNLTSWQWLLTVPRPRKGVWWIMKETNPEAISFPSVCFSIPLYSVPTSPKHLSLREVYRMFSTIHIDDNCNAKQVEDNIGQCPEMWGVTSRRGGGEFLSMGLVSVASILSDLMLQKNLVHRHYIRIMILC
jgi:hypothetical protein